MNLRLALHTLADRHALLPEARTRLLSLGGVGEPPPALAHRWAAGLAVLAAALLGFGLVMWVAANWSELGRSGRFGLLMGWVALTGVGAALRPRARAPLALLSFLGMGALFAYFGQTYQTGADAWQLFALWALLSLPLCLGARSDVLWAPWALVMMTAISLCTYAFLGHRWRAQPDDLATHGVAWIAVAWVVAGLSPAWQHVTGAGVWSVRTAATLGVVMTTAMALGGLFNDPVAPHYVLGLLLLAAAAVLLYQPRAFDVFVLSAVALGLNTLLTAGLARLLFEGATSDPIGPLMLIGLAAAGLLALSVQLILKLTRRHGSAGASSAGATS